MHDAVKCVLRNGYYYARFMGVVNFDVDIRTGRAKITRKTTIYTAVINMMTIGVMPWLMYSQVINGLLSRAGLLHEYLFLAVIVGRVLCVALTLITRWLQRRIYVRIMNSLQELAKKKPQVMKLWTRGVLSKIVSITLTEIFQMLLSLMALNDKFTFRIFFGVGILSAITAQVNVIISQYYFALLNIHGHYILLNEELRLLLDEARSLETEHRKGVFIIKCCALSDQLDIIAGTQFQLQTLVQKLSTIFGLQILSMSISYYMSVVGLIYFVFSEIKSSTIFSIWSYPGLTLMALEFLFYFTDVQITVQVIYGVQNAHALMRDLISQHTLIAPGLDQRLEGSFERFKLQLAWNPLNLSVLNLYSLKKSRVVSMGNSISFRMCDSVQLILRLSYKYSRLLGLFNFEIDTKTGKARITQRATVYAAVVNIAICCMLPLLTQSQLIHILWKYAGLIHEYIFLVVMGMRIICVIATMFSRWWQRRRVIRLINAFRRLTLQKPQVIGMWRHGVYKKFISILVTELIQLLGTILTIRRLLTFNLILSILMAYTLAALVNVIISHFYFAMLNIHIHYVLLKQELCIVLNEIRDLEHEHRKATFMNKCCSLADRLEEIARKQAELQTLGSCMAQVFGLQGLCISASSYVSSIGSIYFTVSAVRRTVAMSWSPVFFLLLSFEIGAYFVDILITIYNVYSVIDDHAELIQLMEQYTSIASGLDKRLEAVFESFQLQLACNPLKISIMGLFNMSKTSAMKMANSIVTSSIVLIQYELKNSTDNFYALT